MPSSPDLGGDPPQPTSKRKSRRDQAAPERPEFLSWFPDNALLQPAIEAFVRGDYHTTRQICSALLDQDLDADVHDAARELLRRLAPDRLVVGVLWGSFVLLALIVLWAYGQQ